MTYSKTTLTWAACTVLWIGACDDSGSSHAQGGAAGSDATGATAPTSPTDPTKPNSSIVRVRDYGEALRTASLKLVGELPTLADIKAIGGAADDAAKKKLLEAAVDKYLADPRFAEQQIAFWRNSFKTGPDDTAAAFGATSMDTAATFAAQIVVEDQPYTNMLTATTNTCPTYADGTFTPDSCTNTTAVAGVLTDPGLMAQFTSNMAFRRVRFVQETFDCTKFPAEVGTGVPMGAGTYTSPWDFSSISGGAGAKIDFHDTSAVICANCHTTMNHIAPLFANFDAAGQLQTTIQVDTPVTPPVTTVLTDWLPAGQPLAWRNGITVTDIPTLGAAMANDPDVLRCAVTRVWNWGLSRGDVVNDGASVPPSVLSDLVFAFASSGLKLKSVIRAVFTSDDFTQF
jgi:hypothetical protein